eukprot:6129175-Pyramimonas_sp.AAC.1
MAMAMSSAVSLADTSRFHGSPAAPTAPTAREHLTFPKHALALELQIHAAPRHAREAGAWGNPCQASISLFAGSRHANNLARAVAYTARSKEALQTPRANPRA